MSTKRDESFEQGPLAIVTGGSSGIGLAISKAFSKALIRVVNVDVKVPKESMDKRIRPIHCDVRSGKEVDQLFHSCQGWGVPDFLVLNAGVGIHERLVDGDPEKWQQVYDTNVMGALRILRAFLPSMKKIKKGHVVFISSVASEKPFASGGIYSSSKSALDTIAETLRIEEAPHIKVSVVSPGITNSEFFENELAGNRNIDDFGIVPLGAENIADQVLRIIQYPSPMVINKLVLRPAAQEF